MSDAATTERKSSRRHRAKVGTGVYVTDQELIEYLGVPEDVARQALRVLDHDRRSGFPQKQKLWGDRRYLPAVQAWLDKQNGLVGAIPATRYEERMIHHRFEHLRTRGEWFRVDDDLLDFIEQFEKDGTMIDPRQLVGTKKERYLWNVE